MIGETIKSNIGSISFCGENGVFDTFSFQSYGNKNKSAHEKLLNNWSL
jgi:hypothetical protein